MTRVNFYLLSDPNEQARMLFACRLGEKAYQKQHKIYMLVNSETDAKKLDQLLWSFRDDSFVPHQIGDENSLAPIRIGTEKPKLQSEILINLTDSIPDYFEQFQRIIEIIPPNEQARSIARDHFRIYRNQGCQLESHQI